MIDNFRKVVAYFVTLCMVLGFAPIGVFASHVYYDITVNGVQVNGSNCDNLLDGTVSFNPSTNTLTLSNAEIEYNGQSGVVYTGSETLTITGTGYITGNMNGICADGSGAIVINGDITATGMAHGILSSSGVDISITGGEVRATGTNELGICAGGNVTVTGNDTVVTAEGGNGGISAGDNFSITGGMVTANGGIGAKSVTIIDSTVVAEGPNAIYANEGDVLITNSNITATSTGFGGSGIFAYGRVSIENASINASAIGENSTGIWGNNGNISIIGDITNLTATGTAYGIFSLCSFVEISGGTVIAEGNDVGISAAYGGCDITLSGGSVTAMSGNSGSAMTDELELAYANGYQWKKADGDMMTKSTATPYEYSSGDTYLKFEPLPPSAAYKVNHWQQKLNAGTEQNESNYTIIETDNLAGDINANIQPYTKTYVGFTSPAKQTITILADGTTELNYYYTRNKYNLFINDVEGVSSVTGAGQYYFEQEVTISATVEAGYKWIEWAGDLSTTECTHTFTMEATGGMILTPIVEGKNNVTINESAQIYMYDNSEKTYEIRGTDLTGFTVSYKQNGQYATPKNVGIYDVVVTRTEDDTYKAFSKTITGGLEITKATVAVPENAGSKSYTGETLTSDILGTEYYDVTTNVGGIDVGEYDVVLTLKNNSNYKWESGEDTETRTVKFAITKASAEITILGETTINKVYGETVSLPDASSTFGTITKNYVDADLVNAGIYTVNYTVEDTNNYTGDTETVTVIISEKKISTSVTLIAPVSNETPQTTIETEEYTATVTWSPTVTEKFDYGTVYTATITITPKVNYTVTGILANEFTVAGAETVTNTADSGVVIASYAQTSARPSSSGGGGISRYTIKFDTNGGNAIQDKTVLRNDKLVKPEDPKKDGYTFMGWFTDKELTSVYDFDTKVIKNFTLYAKWEKVDDEGTGSVNIHNCPSLAYDDLDVTAWYHENIDYVLYKGLMKGTGTKIFDPNGNLTRAMLVTVLYRVEGEPAVNRSICFADVEVNTWYANAVAWAQQNGIVKGYDENTFGPNDNITREQIAAIMHRYAKYKGYDVSVGENTNILSYDDFSSISEWAISNIQYAVGSGLIKGKTTSTINPLDNATRAEIAAILQRFLETNK